LAIPRSVPVLFLKNKKWVQILDFKDVVPKPLKVWKEGKKGRIPIAWNETKKTKERPKKRMAKKWGILLASP